MIEEAGSGVVVKYGDKFYVITNFHVIEGCRPGDIRVEIDGRLHYPARLMHDRQTDLSVIALTGNDFVASRLGDSQKLEIGDFVVAVGSPFGLSHSASYGIVSALGRHDLELGPQGVRYQNFIQTDAAINPGNSGGPLMNLRGEVIGVNTAIASNSGGNDGIGFSIPMNMVMRVTEDLINYGVVNRGFLGVSLDGRYSFAKAKTLGLDYANGALVSNVTPQSPASRAGIATGDVILEYDGSPVADDSQLVTKVSLTPINSTVDVLLYRSGSFQTVQVTIANRKRLRQIE
jgi:serine protease Do